MDEQNQNAPQMQSNQFENGANASETAQPPKKKGIVAVIIAILAIVAVAGVFCFSMANKGAKFVKMITNENLYEIFTATSKIVENNNKISYNLDFDADAYVEVANGSNTDIGTLSVEIENLQDGEKASGSVSFYANKDILAEMKYLRDGTTVAASVTDLFEGYVGLNLEKIDDVKDNMYISKEQLNSYFGGLLQILKGSDDDDTESGLDFTIYEKYLKIVSKYANKNIKNENNVEIEVNGETLKTKKTTLSLDNVTLANMFREIVETMQNDEDLYDSIYGESDLEYSDWQEVCEQLLDEIDTYLDDDAENNEYLVSAYQKFGKTVAVELTLTDVNVRYAVLNDRNNLYSELMLENDDETAKIYAEATKSSDELKTDISLYDYRDGERRDKKILAITVKGKNVKKPHVETLPDDAMMLDEATTSEINSYFSNISYKLTSYITKIASKLSPNMGDLSSSTPNIPKVNFSKFVTSVGDVQDAIIMEATNVKVEQISKGKTITNAQAYNYVAKGGIISSDFVSDVLVPDYTIVEEYADIGMDLPTIKVTNASGTEVAATYAITKKGNVFVWPPFEFDGTYYLNQDSTTDKNSSTKTGSVTIKVNGEYIFIKTDSKGNLISK